MANNRVLWGVTAVASLLAGAAALFVKVKQYALRQLGRDGAFAKADDARVQALQEIHSGKLTDYAAVDTAEPHYTPATQKKVDAINKRWHKDRRDVAHVAGVDRFSGAWKSLSGKDRTKAMGFAAVVSVTVGAAAQIIGRSKGRGGEGSDDAFDYADFGGHHHDGGGFGWHHGDFDFGDIFGGFDF